MNATTENNYLADDSECAEDLITPKSGCGLFMVLCLVAVVLIISGLVKLFK